MINLSKRKMILLILFIENLSREYCSKYGEITECVIMRDREGRSRGFAFVSFKGLFIEFILLNKMNYLCIKRSSNG